MHDFEHGGLNNGFLIKSNDVLALRYNDRSPLENHHLAGSFSVLRTPDCDFMTHMSDEAREIFRKMVIDMVLSTDMQSHFAIFSMFQVRGYGTARPLVAQIHAHLASIRIAALVTRLTASARMRPHTTPASAPTGSHAGSACNKQTPHVHLSVPTALPRRTARTLYLHTSSTPMLQAKLIQSASRANSNELDSERSSPGSGTVRSSVDMRRSSSLRRFMRTTSGNSTGTNATDSTRESMRDISFKDLEDMHLSLIFQVRCLAMFECTP